MNALAGLELNNSINLGVGKKNKKTHILYIVFMHRHRLGEIQQSSSALPFLHLYAYFNRYIFSGSVDAAVSPQALLK